MGHIADEGPGPPPARLLEVDGPRVGELAQNGAEEGGLARSVGADEGGDLPAVEVEADMLQNGLLPQRDGQVRHLQATGPRAAGAGVFVLFDAHCRASRMVPRLAFIASI